MTKIRSHREPGFDFTQYNKDSPSVLLPHLDLTVTPVSAKELFHVKHFFKRHRDG